MSRLQPSHQSSRRPHHLFMSPLTLLILTLLLTFLTLLPSSHVLGAPSSFPAAEPWLMTTSLGGCSSLSPVDSTQAIGEIVTCPSYGYVSGNNNASTPTSVTGLSVLFSALDSVTGKIYLVEQLANGAHALTSSWLVARQISKRWVLPNGVQVVGLVMGPPSTTAPPSSATPTPDDDEYDAATVVLLTRQPQLSVQSFEVATGILTPLLTTTQMTAGGVRSIIPGMMAFNDAAEEVYFVGLQTSTTTDLYLFVYSFRTSLLTSRRLLSCTQPVSLHYAPSVSSLLFVTGTGVRALGVPSSGIHEIVTSLATQAIMYEEEEDDGTTSTSVVWEFQTRVPNFDAVYSSAHWLPFVNELMLGVRMRNSSQSNVTSFAMVRMSIAREVHDVGTATESYTYRSSSMTLTPVTSLPLLFHGGLAPLEMRTLLPADLAHTDTTITVRGIGLTQPIVRTSLSCIMQAIDANDVETSTVGVMASSVSSGSVSNSTKLYDLAQVDCAIPNGFLTPAIRSLRVSLVAVDGRLLSLSPLLVPVLCPAGSYLTSNSSCALCSAGSFKSVLGPDACTTCPPNTRTPLGSISYSACLFGNPCSVAVGGLLELEDGQNQPALVTMRLGVTFAAFDASMQHIFYDLLTSSLSISRARLGPLTVLADGASTSTILVRFEIVPASRDSYEACLANWRDGNATSPAGQSPGAIASELEAQLTDPNSPVHRNDTVPFLDLPDPWLGVEPSACPAGRYLVNSTCPLCPAGSFKSTNTSQSCTACQSGAISPIGSVSSSACLFGQPCDASLNGAITTGNGANEPALIRMKLTTTVAMFDETRQAAFLAMIATSLAIPRVRLSRELSVLPDTSTTIVVEFEILPASPTDYAQCKADWSAGNATNPAGWSPGALAGELESQLRDPFSPIHANDNGALVGENAWQGASLLLGGADCAPRTLWSIVALVACVVGVLLVFGWKRGERRRSMLAPNARPTEILYAFLPLLAIGFDAYFIVSLALAETLTSSTLLLVLVGASSVVLVGGILHNSISIMTAARTQLVVVGGIGGKRIGGEGDSGRSKADRYAPQPFVKPEQEEEEEEESANESEVGVSGEGEGEREGQHPSGTASSRHTNPSKLHHTPSSVASRGSGIVAKTLPIWCRLHPWACRIYFVLGCLHLGAIAMLTSKLSRSSLYQLQWDQALTRDGDGIHASIRRGMARALVWRHVPMCALQVIAYLNLGTELECPTASLAPILATALAILVIMTRHLLFSHLPEPFLPPPPIAKKLSISSSASASDSSEESSVSSLSSSFEHADANALADVTSAADFQAAAVPMSPLPGTVLTCEGEDFEEARLRPHGWLTLDATEEEAAAVAAAAEAARLRPHGWLLASGPETDIDQPTLFPSFARKKGRQLPTGAMMKKKKVAPIEETPIPPPSSALHNWQLYEDYGTQLTIGHFADIQLPREIPGADSDPSTSASGVATEHGWWLCEIIDETPTDLHVRQAAMPGASVSASDPTSTIVGVSHWISKVDAKVQPARSITIGEPVPMERAPKPIGAPLSDKAIETLTLPTPPPPATPAVVPSDAADNVKLVEPHQVPLPDSDDDASPRASRHRASSTPIIADGRASFTGDGAVVDDSSSVIGDMSHVLDARRCDSIVSEVDVTPQSPSCNSMVALPPLPECDSEFEGSARESRLEVPASSSSSVADDNDHGDARDNSVSVSPLRSPSMTPSQRASTPSLRPSSSEQQRETRTRTPPPESPLTSPTQTSSPSLRSFNSRPLPPPSAERLRRSASTLDGSSPSPSPTSASSIAPHRMSSLMTPLAPRVRSSAASMDLTSSASPPSPSLAPTVSSSPVILGRASSLSQVNRLTSNGTSAGSVTSSGPVAYLPKRVPAKVLGFGSGSAREKLTAEQIRQQKQAEKTAASRAAVAFASPKSTVPSSPLRSPASPSSSAALMSPDHHSSSIMSPQTHSFTPQSPLSFPSLSPPLSSAGVISSFSPSSLSSPSPSPSPSRPPLLPATIQAPFHLRPIVRPPPPRRQ